MKTRNQISFILDGEVTTLKFDESAGYRPTTTVLNYLRSLSGHKGVKEGCGEGDCGACTVVLAGPGPDGKLIYRSYDSCLVFLPMIHGKQLITVENLAIEKNGQLRLHPVQQVMVDLGGSQCGYCTPGIVMSLFALYKREGSITREVAEDALTGNLCRCTGYRPILESAMKVCGAGTADHFTQGEPQILQRLREIEAIIPSVELQARGQHYFRPARMKEALKIIRKHPDVIIVNGATDVALRQTKKFEFLKKILDLSGIKELRFFKTRKGEYHIGAGLSMEELKTECEKRLPALFEMLTVFASLQIRNIASIGGNIGSASPIGDILPLLFAHKARIVIAGLDGNREVPIEAFIRGYRKTDLAPGELIHSVIIPKPEKKVRIRSYKISKRRDLDISTVSAAFRIELDEAKQVKDIVLAYGGMAECTKRAVKAEEFIRGKTWSRETAEAAAEVVKTDFTPISDARSGKAFRSVAAANLLMKFFAEC